MDILLNRFRSPTVFSPFTAKVSKTALAFHRQLPGYEATPLIELPALAQKLHLGGLYVKDESARLGLNSFKVLGSSFAIGQYLAQKTGVPMAKLDVLAAAKALPPTTFVTASAGNHGVGLAWAAKTIGQKALVFLPATASMANAQRIRALGASVIRTSVDYDEAVREAARVAKDQGWVLVQDTGLKDYEEIPTWISQGYETMMAEILATLKEKKLGPPTHVFLQAGVGAMAGGVLGCLTDAWGSENFTAVIVEPQDADCLYRSAATKDGHPTKAKGPLDSVMTGLACGEVNPITWPVIRAEAAAFIRVEDAVAEQGKELLTNPEGSDPVVNAGPCGAVGVGVLANLRDAQRQELRLFKESCVLVINTEGG